jgi:hypothetical protein
VLDNKLDDRLDVGMFGYVLLKMSMMLMRMMLLRIRYLPLYLTRKVHVKDQSQYAQRALLDRTKIHHDPIRIHQEPGVRCAGRTEGFFDP